MVNLSYKELSLIQAGCIILTAISVFDMGFANHDKPFKTTDKGLWFNHTLFHLEELPSFITESAFWGEFQFWGYCFLIVAICQVLKAMTHEN